MHSIYKVHVYVFIIMQLFHFYCFLETIMNINIWNWFEVSGESFLNIFKYLIFKYFIVFIFEFM